MFSFLDNDLDEVIGLIRSWTCITQFFLGKASVILDYSLQTAHFNLLKWRESADRRDDKRKSGVGASNQLRGGWQQDL